MPPWSPENWIAQLDDVLEPMHPHVHWTMRGLIVGWLAMCTFGCAESAKPISAGLSDAASVGPPDAGVGGYLSDSGEAGAQVADGLDATMAIGDDAIGIPIGAADSPSADAPASPGDGALPGDAGGIDHAQADAAQGTGGCAGLFCEDFEQGQIDPAKWATQTGAGGTLDIEQQIVAHGRYAMHVHGLAGPADYALIVTKSVPPALRAANFGRANFFITPSPLMSGHTQMLFSGTNGTGAANGPGPFPKLRYMEVGNSNGGWQIGFDLLDISPLVEEVVHPAGSPPVPVTTWTCLEWQFTDQPDVVNLWVDGAATGVFDNQHVSFPAGHTPGTPLYNGTSSGLIGSYTVFGFGFHDWHPNKPFDLYYDDIVLDTKRVGCLAAGDR